MDPHQLDLSSDPDLVSRLASLDQALQKLPVAERVKVLDDLQAEKRRYLGASLSKLKVYADPPNPLAFASDVLGYKTSPQQEGMFELFLAYDRVLIVACTDIGKSDVAGIWGLFKCFVTAQLPDPAGTTDEPQGCVLTLLGPTHDVIRDNIWQRMCSQMRMAEARGWNFSDVPSGLRRSLRTPEWIIGPNWFIRPLSPEKKAGGVGTAHSASGRHSANHLALIEEGSGMEERVWYSQDQGLSGLGNQIVTLMNPDPLDPDEALAPAFSRYKSGLYKTVFFSAFDFPNVIHRETIIGGGALSHIAIDRDVKHQCDLLPRNAVPDPKRYDFRYALPPKGAPEHGGREDEIPGHPDGEIRVYRPSPGFVASRLGRFPEGLEDCPFSSVTWDHCVDLWHEHFDQHTLRFEAAPDGIGVDPARISRTGRAVARWGPTAWEMLKQLRLHQDDQEDVEQLPKVMLGEIFHLTPGDGYELAKQLVEHYPTGDFSIDIGGHGSSPADFLRRDFNRKLVPIQFGGKARRRLKEEMACFNLRTQMCIRLAELVRHGLILLPPDKKLKEIAMQQRLEAMDKYSKVLGSVRAEKVFKLKKKDEGFDEFDAVCCAVAGMQGGGLRLV